MRLAYSRIESFLREHVDSGLKKMGLRQTGRVYRLGAKRESQGFLFIQASDASTALCSVFYVGIGVLPRPFIEYMWRN
jgi:hypothetical protein